MQKNNNEYLRNLQRNIFGERYVDASLSKIDIFPEGTLEKASEWMKNPKNFLILMGPPGIGKTYFCSAMLEKLPRNIRTVRGYNEKNLLKRIRQSIGETKYGDYISFLQQMIDDDLIIIDDLGATTPNEWRSEIIFELIDHRYTSRKPTVFTTNLNKENFNKMYGFRASSRFFSKENIILDLFECEDLRKEGL